MRKRDSDSLDVLESLRYFGLFIGALAFQAALAAIVIVVILEFGDSLNTFGRRIVGLLLPLVFVIVMGSLAVGLWGLASKRAARR